MQFLIAGIIGLMSFIGSLFTRSVSVALEYSAKRLLIIASVVALMATFVAAFYFAIKQTIDSIALVAPPQLSIAASLCVPDNLPMIVSLQLTARLLRFAYEWNVKVLQWRL